MRAWSLVAAAVPLLLAGCDQRTTARFYNLTENPLTLYVDSGAPVVAKSGLEIAPGRSVRLASWRILDAPLELRTRDCRYAYRAISSREEGFNAVWGVQSVLDVHPDLRISLKGWWGYGFTFMPAKAQPKGWPLQPLSKTCP